MGQTTLQKAMRVLSIFVQFVCASYTLALALIWRNATQTSSFFTSNKVLARKQIG